MNSYNRRQFIHGLAVAGACGGAGLLSFAQNSGAAKPGNRKMTINLVCGAIGVSANQTQAIDLAHRHGFESVEAQGEHLASLSKDQLDDLLADMKSKGVVFGAAGLPVDFRGADDSFRKGLKGLPRIAAGLQRAGVTRVGTWLSPAHSSLTYLRNFRQHAERLREAAQILRDYGQKLGLEYVGTQTLRNRMKYPFVHTLAETKELIAEIGTGNAGLVMDSWHWWTAGDTEADILALRADEVVAADLNDAPAGIPKEAQLDNQRELPAATGVIDVAVFLNALNKIGYDGPVRAEPFNQALRDLDNEAACAATIQAMKKAFALIR